MNIALTNVVLLSSAVERAMNRPADLPGLVVQYGPSGYGKSARRHSSPTSTVPTMWNAATRGPARPSCRPSCSTWASAQPRP